MENDPWEILRMGSKNDFGRFLKNVEKIINKSSKPSKTNHLSGFRAPGVF